MPYETSSLRGCGDRARSEPPQLHRGGPAAAGFPVWARAARASQRSPRATTAPEFCDSPGGDADAAILDQIRELAGQLGDERTRKIIQNVTDVMQLNPQPLPPAALRAILDAVALNPQPLPPSRDPGDATSGR